MFDPAVVQIKERPKSSQNRRQPASSTRRDPSQFEREDAAQIERCVRRRNR